MIFAGRKEDELVQQEHKPLNYELHSAPCGGTGGGGLMGLGCVRCWVGAGQQGMLAFYSLAALCHPAGVALDWDLHQDKSKVWSTLPGTQSSVDI